MTILIRQISSSHSICFNFPREKLRSSNLDILAPNEDLSLDAVGQQKFLPFKSSIKFTIRKPSNKKIRADQSWVTGTASINFSGSRDQF